MTELDRVRSSYVATMPGRTPLRPQQSNTTKPPPPAEAFTQIGSKSARYEGASGGTVEGQAAGRDVCMRIHMQQEAARKVQPSR